MIDFRSSAWRRVRRNKDYQAGLEIISPWLDLLYDWINAFYFGGELVDVPISDGTVPKFRVMGFDLSFPWIGWTYPRSWCHTTTLVDVDTHPA